MGSLLLFSKLFLYLPLILLYGMLFMLDIKSSEIRSSIYWVLVLALTCSNLTYIYLNSWYMVFGVLFFVVFCIMDWIFATHPEILKLSKLTPIPYIYYELKLFKYLGRLVIKVGATFLYYCAYLLISLPVQLMVIYVVFISSLFILINLVTGETKKRRLSFSQGKINLFLKNFRKHLFDFRLMLLFILSLIKNYPFIVFPFFAASIYFDHNFIFCSYIIVAAIFTLIVSYPETQLWNKTSFNNLALRLLGFNILRGAMYGSRVIVGAAGSLTALSVFGVTIINKANTKADLLEAQIAFDQEKVGIEEELLKQKAMYSVTDPMRAYHEKRYKDSLDLLGERPRLKDIKPRDILGEGFKNL